MTTLAKLIREPASTIFRRAYIKRRDATTGLYESDWFEITEFVKAWGKAKTSIDDLRLNRFLLSGLDLKVRNDEGSFNQEIEDESLWSGYLTRYRTLVKIEAGYLDENGTEFPTNSSLGVFLMDNEIVLSTKDNDTVLQLSSIANPFNEVRADEVDGLANSQTASEIMTFIRDATDGSGSYIFRQFISAASWFIQTTTTQYQYLTTQLPNLSVWDLMNKLAEAEGFVLNVTRTGGFEFRDRSQKTTTSSFEFFGQNFNRPNIIEILQLKQAINKLYTNIRLKFNEADTTTSYVEAGDDVVVNNSSTSWIYGRRHYQFENLMMNSTSAQTTVNNLLSLFATPKLEAQVEAKFTPGIEVGDKVEVSYATFKAKADLWDSDAWASDLAIDPADGLNWGLPEGESIDFRDKEFLILSKQHDLDKLKTKLVLREV